MFQGCSWSPCPQFVKLVSTERPEFFSGKTFLNNVSSGPRFGQLGPTVGKLVQTTKSYMCGSRGQQYGSWCSQKRHLALMGRQLAPTVGQVEVALRLCGSLRLVQRPLTPQNFDDTVSSRGTTASSEARFNKWHVPCVLFFRLCFRGCISARDFFGIDFARSLLFHLFIAMSVWLVQGFGVHLLVWRSVTMKGAHTTHENFKTQRLTNQASYQDALEQQGKEQSCHNRERCSSRG